MKRDSFWCSKVQTSMSSWCAIKPCPSKRGPRTSIIWELTRCKSGHPVLNQNLQFDKKARWFVLTLSFGNYWWNKYWWCLIHVVGLFCLGGIYIPGMIAKQTREVAGALLFLGRACSEGRDHVPRFLVSQQLVQCMTYWGGWMDGKMGRWRVKSMISLSLRRKLRMNIRNQFKAEFGFSYYWVRKGFLNIMITI